MSDNELIEIYNEMVEIYGDQIPHPEHEPIRFAYYVKLYKTYHVNA